MPIDRLVLGLALIAIAVGQTASAADCSYLLTSPDGSELWHWGSRHDVTWSSSGVDCADQITLELFQDNVFVQEITGPATNSGLYQWLIGAGPGTGFTLRVVDATTPAFFDESDAPFEIGEVTCDVEVESPVGDEVWIRGMTYETRWYLNGGDCELSSANLYLKPTNTFIGIAYSGGYNGPDRSYLWTIPIETEPRSDYRLEVWAGLDVAQSAGTFSIVDCGLLCDGFESGDTTVWSASVP